MTEPEVREFYAPGGLNAAIYDARVARPKDAPRSGDIELYLVLAERTGGPVLELGCGPGRVAFSLTEAGYDIVGLDLSEGMLEHGRRRLEQAPEDVQRRLRFVHGDMTDFSIDRSFGLVLTPFRSFQALLTPQAQRNCLDAIRRHLRPDGVLVLELFDPLFSLLEPGAMQDEAPDHEYFGENAFVDPQSGLPVEVRVLGRVNHTVEQVLEETWRFTVRDETGAVVREERELLRLRWTYRWELRHLLELCGFEVEAEYSDFKLSPPAYGKEQIVVARHRDVAGG